MTNCSGCAKRIEETQRYHVCSECERHAHLEHRCIVHPNAYHYIPNNRDERVNVNLHTETPIISHPGRRFFEYGIIGAAIGLALRGILTGGGHLDDWLFNYYDYIGLNDKDIDRSIHILPYGVIIPVFLSLVASFYLVYRVIKK